uniref:Uncharacterized protein n=1 Tax=Erwinia amylovora ATCC BAA-2158 TaxID=889211 RepID=E5B9Q1_ERWAM|nr:hypothetical protein predicted by Glimmer/Critica [Erwinia amylovora ATCC BAA-2158]
MYPLVIGLFSVFKAESKSMSDIFNFNLISLGWL